MQRLQSALPSLVVWPFDQEAAFHYGSIAAELRRAGAIALNLGGCTVVTTESELLAIPGLTVERW